MKNKLVRDSGHERIRNCFGIRMILTTSREKRWRTSALQDACAKYPHTRGSGTFWSAAALRRFSLRWQALTSLALIAISLMTFSAAIASDTRYFEMRRYHAAPGKLDALNARFRDHTMKLFEKHGMENIGYWMPATNTENLLIYILAYPSKEARAASWKAFSSDPEWKQVVKESEANGRLVTKVDQTFMRETDYSPTVKPSSGAERVFELRTYTTHDGRLDNLNKRFRDHTMSLFEKHGIENFGYWIPYDKPNTLVYILAHKNLESAKNSWTAFRADPEWNKAKKASETEAGGPLTVDKGVKSEFLIPTDYSPTK